jgi:hypothetical protein
MNSNIECAGNKIGSRNRLDRVDGRLRLLGAMALFEGFRSKNGTLVSRRSMGRHRLLRRSR